MLFLSCFVILSCTSVCRYHFPIGILGQVWCLIVSIPDLRPLSFFYLGEILDELKARAFNATSLSTYDFSTLYTTLPHNLIKDKLIDLIERTFNREGSPYLACNDRNAFLLWKTLKMSCMVLSKSM